MSVFDGYTTIKDVAHELNVHVNTVQKWVESGKLASAILPNGYRMIPVAAYEACKDSLVVFRHQSRMEDATIVNVSCSGLMAKRLGKIAAEMGISRSALARIAIEAYLDKEEKAHG